MILFSWYIDFVSWLEMHALPCMFKKTFHINCPGCGLQRSIFELLKGNIVGSFYQYPPLIPLLIYLGFLLADRKYRFKFSKKLTFYGLIAIFAIIVTSYTLQFIVK